MQQIVSSQATLRSTANLVSDIHRAVIIVNASKIDYLDRSWRMGCTWRLSLLICALCRSRRRTLSLHSIHVRANGRRFVSQCLLPDSDNPRISSANCCRMTRSWRRCAMHSGMNLSYRVDRAHRESNPLARPQWCTLVLIAIS